MYSFEPHKLENPFIILNLPQDTVGKFSQLLAVLFCNKYYVVLYCSSYCTTHYTLHNVVRYILLTLKSLTVECSRIKIHQREGFFRKNSSLSFLLNSIPAYGSTTLHPSIHSGTRGKKIEAILSETKFKGFKYNL